MFYPRFNYKIFSLQTYIEIFNSITTVNQVAILLAAVTITILIFNNEFLKPRVSKKTSVPIPIELIVVVGGTLLSKYLHMEEAWSIIPVGHIPVGLPSPTIPSFSLWKDLLVDSFAIAFVSYSVTVSMALIFGQKLKYEINFNQELLAMVKLLMLTGNESLSKKYLLRRALETFLHRSSLVCRSRLRSHDHLFNKQLVVRPNWLQRYLVVCCFSSCFGLDPSLKFFQG